MAAVILLAAGPALAAGQCMTARLDEPFLLPDGSVQPSGNLTLCLERAYSPVSSLHEVRVNGMGVGLFVSRHGTSEGLSNDGLPFMMFHRRSGGELVLVGLASPARDHMQLHVLGTGIRQAEADFTRVVNQDFDNPPVLVRARSY